MTERDDDEPEPPRRQCGTCAWFRPLTEDESRRRWGAAEPPKPSGTCHGAPPVPNDELRPLAAWPVVPADEWCRLWEVAPQHSVTHGVARNREGG